MYLYSFNKFFGADKVTKVTEDFQKITEDEKGLQKTNKKLQKMKKGDLISVDGDFCINLGEKISFSEQYTNVKAIKGLNVEIIYKGLLSEKSINLIHWMVDTYYCTYKSLMKYFLPAGDVSSLLERETRKQKNLKNIGKIGKNISQIGKNSEKSEKNKSSCASHHPYFVKEEKKDEFQIADSGQTLIVFPDLWTLFNHEDYGGLVQRITEDKNVSFLSSTQTQNQKDKNWRDIKKGNKSVILATYGEIFQDYNDLKKIIFIDPHKWYYANQQDPRFKVGDVLEKMKEIYNAELLSIGC